MTRGERQAETRQRLVEAAATAFAAHGFVGASVEVIAEAAGYSKGAFYSNFDTKDELALAVLEWLLEDDGTGLGELFQKHEGEAEALFQAVAEEFTLRHANQWVWALRLELLLHAGRDERFRAVASSLYRRQREAYARLVDEGLKKIGVTAPSDALVIADALLAVDHGHTALVLAGAEPTPVGETLLLLLRALTGGMRGLRVAAT